ncbi:MAG TPA: hypothetical protein VEL74_03765 [Thermoanaerobaculia bacterium]|nr:hypothetical protein [Thermoanaerobaculia bacterium]
MHKKAKKLSLSRETVRTLDQSFLPNIAGADTAFQTNCGTCTNPSYCRRCLPSPTFLYGCETNTCDCPEL